MNPAKRRLALTGLIVAAALFGPVAATASKTADVILNQTQASDAIGDSGTGPDLSSLTITTYADGTVSFLVQFANRAFLQLGETVQIFVDLNNDGQSDLNLSIWPSHDPSYLDRWTGTDWQDVRQLPELVQASGSISVRLSLSELQSAAGVPVAPAISVRVGSWTEDSTGTLPAAADDWLPSATTRVLHSIKATATATTTTTATAAPTTTGTAAASAKTTRLPLTIEPLAPLTVESGKDVTLHILLKSRAGPVRLFKACTQLAPTPGVPNLTQCRSTESSGANGAVPFTITYRITRVGTTRVSIAANAGTARATTAAVIHVSKT